MLVYQRVTSIFELYRYTCIIKDNSPGKRHFAQQKGSSEHHYRLQRAQKKRIGVVTRQFQGG